MPELEPVDLVVTDPSYFKTKCGKGKKSLGGMLDKNKDLLDFDEWLEKVKKAYRQSLKKQEKKSMAILSKKLNK